jgi:trans-2,3-dihydro-3-hydroxyanthranilate isomerase
MHALIVTWDLSAGSKVSIEKLREYIRDESMARFRQVVGLRQKTWISNPETQQWGAFYLFERREQADNIVAHVNAGRVAELTGLKPTIERFEVEAVIEGQHSGVDLLSSGLAVERAGAR